MLLRTPHPECGVLSPVALRTLEAQHDTDMRKLREDLQSERCRHLEDLELRLRDQEMEKQREVGRGALVSTT